MKIPIEIQKIRDPDGVERLRATVSLSYVISDTFLNINLVDIQDQYICFIKTCKEYLAYIHKNKKNRGEPILKWNLSDMIYKFIKKIEEKGFIFANVTKSLSRDLGISVRQINYLIEFRLTYPDVKTIHREISWDKYKELLDISDQSFRKRITEKILRGELKTREDIRKFKKIFNPRF